MHNTVIQYILVILSHFMLLVCEVVELVMSTNQHCGGEMPGTVGILWNTKRRSCLHIWESKFFEIQKSISSRSPSIEWKVMKFHLNGKSCSRNISDNKATAPPVRYVGVTSMDQKSVMDLHKAASKEHLNVLELI